MCKEWLMYFYMKKVCKSISRDKYVTHANDVQSNINIVYSRFLRNYINEIVDYKNVVHPPIQQEYKNIQMRNNEKLCQK